MTRDWSDYQEEVADFFRSLGIPADTNVTLVGVRGRHAVDVVARPTVAGQHMLWIVECKLWKSRVPKEKVLTLQGVVQDVGADRGFMMAENGYQRGALRMARLSNITLESLQDLRETAEFDLGAVELRTQLRRAAELQSRYWGIDKSRRIDVGLRPDVGLPGYSARAVLDEVFDSIGTALTLGFPLKYLHLQTAPFRLESELVISPLDLVAVVRPHLDEVERLLDIAERPAAE